MSITTTIPLGSSHELHQHRDGYINTQVVIYYIVTKEGELLQGLFQDDFVVPKITHSDEITPQKQPIKSCPVVHDD